MGEKIFPETIETERLFFGTVVNRFGNPNGLRRAKPGFGQLHDVFYLSLTKSNH